MTDSLSVVLARPFDNLSIPELALTTLTLSQSHHQHDNCAAKFAAYRAVLAESRDISIR